MIDYYPLLLYYRIVIKWFMYDRTAQWYVYMCIFRILYKIINDNYIYSYICIACIYMYEVVKTYWCASYEKFLQCTLATGLLLRASMGSCLCIIVCSWSCCYSCAGEHNKYYQEPRKSLGSIGSVVLEDRC